MTADSRISKTSLQNLNKAANYLSGLQNCHKLREEWINKSSQNDITRFSTEKKSLPLKGKLPVKPPITRRHPTTKLNLQQTTPRLTQLAGMGYNENRLLFYPQSQEQDGTLSQSPFKLSPRRSTVAGYSLNPERMRISMQQKRSAKVDVNRQNANQLRKPMKLKSEGRSDEIGGDDNQLNIFNSITFLSCGLPNNSSSDSPNSMRKPFYSGPEPTRQTFLSTDKTLHVAPNTPFTDRSGIL